MALAVGAADAFWGSSRARPGRRLAGNTGDRASQAADHPKGVDGTRQKTDSRVLQHRPDIRSVAGRLDLSRREERQVWVADDTGELRGNAKRGLQLDRWGLDAARLEPIEVRAGHQEHRMDNRPIKAHGPVCDGRT